MAMETHLRVVFFLVNVVVLGVSGAAGGTAVGDPGMRRDGLRVAFEAWNFCNEVGQEAPGMGSPRAADCFDLSSSFLKHKVSEADNKLGVGQPFPGMATKAINNTDLYAVQKELYLGSLCQVEDTPNPWQFWMVMLKNGNYDTTSGLCPRNGKKVPPFSPGRFPCFGKGCMNQPMLYHQQTKLSDGGIMRGSFNGTYDLGSDIGSGLDGISFYEVVWEKTVHNGSWVFSHKLKTSKKYPWLMLYLRADATTGFSGGYHYDTRGMLKIVSRNCLKYFFLLNFKANPIKEKKTGEGSLVCLDDEGVFLWLGSNKLAVLQLPESPNFKVRVTLDVKQGGGPKSQFYLIDIGSCWKNNGAPCDGDVLTDITRYSEMIINPETRAWCSPTNLGNCPPYHITPNNTKIYRNDTANFPYGAYHYYCAPENAQFLEKPVSTCDPYSNPQAQELVQLLPHPIWADYGYPTKQGDGWVGDARTWELDVGGLASRLYFYQDPGTPPARRIWRSIDMGTEIFVSDKDEVAEWTISDFDVTFT
ncbi:hypothetical protein POTOM_010691 [Populus tomentosa]|uniref:DUF7705 domain-containing protein n=1 Tax=Populus tomentosa TaxID=118781 RepID=A0A8X8AE14_POPTO|nr:hypothetical protein POTOM_010691 [Populus tomentosa]